MDWMGWIPQAEFVAPLIFSALAFVTVVGLGLPWLQPDIFASRLKVIRQRRDELSRRRRELLEARRPALRRETRRVDFMRGVLERLKLANLLEQPDLKAKLVHAGWRGPAALITFTFLRLATPPLCAGLAALVVFVSGRVHVSTMLGVAICAFAALLGFYLPSVFLANAGQRRQQDIQKSFPDALDLTVICVEAGLSLEAAFGHVSDDMGEDAPAIAEEIALTTAELAFLGDRRLALTNLATRTGSTPIKSLVTALIQSERYGTPLGGSLRVVAQESRDSRMARAEEKAASLPAKLTVPMVMFFLPVLFAVLIGPTIIQVIRTFSHG